MLFQLFQEMKQLEHVQGLVNKLPSSHTGAPKILSRPNSALAIEHPKSVPITHPPSCAATPLMHNASVTGKEGSAAPMKLMSQPHWPETATASPELPSGSSQEDGSQLGQTNENFQSSGSSPDTRNDPEILWWGLGYRWGNERVESTSSCTSIHDAQNSTTLIPFRTLKPHLNIPKKRINTSLMVKTPGWAK